MQQLGQREVQEEHIRHLEEPTLLLEGLLDTLVPLEVDTLVHLGQATQLQDLDIQLQGQATQHTRSQATQHSLEATLLSLAIHLLQVVILLLADQEVILLLQGLILLLQGLIPLLLEVIHHPHLALHIPLSDNVHMIAFRCDSGQ